MPENFVTALKVSIIGSSKRNIELIKTVLDKIPLKVILVQTYSPDNVFPILFTDLDSVDFIVTDHTFFAILEEKKQTITVPLIVFTTDNTELKSLYNNIFEIISIPPEIHKIERTIKKIEILKKHFEISSKSKIRNNDIAHNTSRTFLIKKGKEFQLINTDDIAIFYTDNKLTFACNIDGSKFLIQSTLIELETLLNDKLFFRANRQCLINRKHITKINQLEDSRFEIVVNTVTFLQIDINQQKFFKLKEWIENN
jgi:DNA-binding LytR/AlgR family response regulator